MPRIQQSAHITSSTHPRNRSDIPLEVSPSATPDPCFSHCSGRQQTKSSLFFTRPQRIKPAIRNFSAPTQACQEFRPSNVAKRVGARPFHVFPTGASLHPQHPAAAAVSSSIRFQSFLVFASSTDGSLSAHVASQSRLLAGIDYAFKTLLSATSNTSSPACYADCTFVSICLSVCSFSTYPTVCTYSFCMADSVCLLVWLLSVYTSLFDWLSIHVWLIIQVCD